jgi:hypothetical protein
MIHPEAEQLCVCPCCPDLEPTSLAASGRQSINRSRARDDEIAANHLFTTHQSLPPGSFPVTRFISFLFSAHLSPNLFSGQDSPQSAARRKKGLRRRKIVTFFVNGFKPFFAFMDGRFLPKR